jgi:hypothetical protein
MVRDEEERRWSKRRRRWKRKRRRRKWNGRGGNPLRNLHFPLSPAMLLCR